MTGDTRARLVVGGDEFGWGSAGVLAAVLDEVERRFGGTWSVSAFSQSSLVNVLKDRRIDTWLPGGAERSLLTGTWQDPVPDVAVVALNAPMAKAFTTLGVPTVFIDTLPYMWTRPEELPLAVDVYCAQRFGDEHLPDGSPVLEAVNLQWVGGVVGSTPPPAPRRAGLSTAMVSLGGLSSPFNSKDTVRAYLRLVCRPLLLALQQSGFGSVLLAGAVHEPDLDVLDLPPGSVRPTIWSTNRAEFLDRAAASDLLCTSPGFTTMLEFGAIGSPAVVLPPQNLTQMSSWLSVARLCPGICVPWPDWIVDRTSFAALRDMGEDRALETIYGAIEEAAAEPHAADAVLEAAFADAVTTSGSERSADSSLRPLFAMVGDTGAADVVRHAASLIY